MNSLQSTVEISNDEGRTFTAYPISFEFTSSRATDEDLAAAHQKIGLLGWVNGTVTVADQQISVGGGWVNEDGSIEPYAYNEIGDIRGLIIAAGLAERRAEILDEDVSAVMQMLRNACPEHWDVSEARNDH